MGPPVAPFSPRSTSVAGFTVASILCGAAQSLVQIVLFRILQGLCGAALVPLSQSVLLSIYPRDRQGSAMALWGVAVMAGPILGPVLGGWLTANYSWRYVFYINVPIGILAFVGMVTFLTETARNTTAKLDWFGFGTLSVAIGALQPDSGERRLSGPPFCCDRDQVGRALFSADFVSRISV